MPAPGRVLVDDVWESFRIFHDRPVSIRERLVGRRKTVAEEFWALKGVSFEVAPGESFAVIGPNGSGKSTLLKCLARILEPTRGRVEIEGRLAALLELGAGFHGDLTGRENVYLNASILGFRERDVDAIFDDIVDFSELEEFIDTPVRNYSSGMFVRLGFAVAINLEPQVLLVDEVLAVGDARFQQRCFERIRAIQRVGTTIVLVTHDLDSATTLCRQAVLLDKGELVASGKSHDVADAYRRRVADSGAYRMSQFAGGEVEGSGELALTNIRIVGDTGKEYVESGERFAICFEAEAQTAVDNPVFGLIIRGHDGAYLFDTNTLWRRQRTGVFAPGAKAAVRFELTANLLPGSYLVTVAASDADGKRALDWHTDVLPLEIRGAASTRGIVDLNAGIHVEGL